MFWGGFYRWWFYKFQIFIFKTYMEPFFKKPNNFKNMMGAGWSTENLNKMYFKDSIEVVTLLT